MIRSNRLLRQHLFRLAACAASLLLVPISATGDAPSHPAGREVQIRVSTDRLRILIGDRVVADYVFRDPTIRRPYFCNLRAVDGTPVTRTHPPVPGVDAEDHATMHPGLWLAFGDINGEDFWRNQAEIRHQRVAVDSDTASNGAAFTQHKQYVGTDGRIVCTEQFVCRIRAVDDGWLLDWTSEFRTEDECEFGDQEEMGLGVRLATPLTERAHGQLRDATGRRGASQIWGQSADWCDYGGPVDGRRAGVALLCDPQNVRPSWMHARDYGLLVANPFGRHAMRQGPRSRWQVTPDRPLRLRYVVFVYSLNSETPVADVLTDTFDRVFAR